MFPTSNASIIGMFRRKGEVVKAPPCFTVGHSQQGSQHQRPGTRLTKLPTTRAGVPEVVTEGVHVARLRERQRVLQSCRHLYDSFLAQQVYRLGDIVTV